MPTRLAERTKSCTRCGIEKPWSQFYANTKWPDGSTRSPQSRCKKCQGELSNLRHQDPRYREWHRNWQRQAYHRWKQDPEWMATKREQSRSYRRRVLDIPPHRWRRDRGPVALSLESVPAEPFAAWLRGQLALLGELEILASQFGLSDSTARRLMTGRQARVSITTVDRALLNADDSTRLDDLYPMEQLEPDPSHG